jgi:hypothetical protein
MPQLAQLDFNLDRHSLALTFITVADGDGDNWGACHGEEGVGLEEVSPWDEATTTCLFPRARARFLAT